MSFSPLEKARREIEARLDEMYSIIVEMIDYSLERPEETLKRERSVNALEIDIDELIVQTIALYHPEASPLREILMALKINNDLERIGDHAENVARDVKFFSEKGEDISDLWDDIALIRDMARRSFVEAYSSFKNKDASLAKEIWRSDYIVDALRDKILKRAVDTLPTPVALKTVSIAQNFERIADLSTNIAEDVVFIVEGEIIKHKPLEEIE